MSWNSHLILAPFCWQIIFRLNVLPTEDDTMSESSADSLLWSDDDCSQDIDVTVNPDEELEDDDKNLEIVRCICEVEEENDFMIQVYSIDLQPEVPKATHNGEHISTFLNEQAFSQYP